MRRSRFPWILLALLAAASYVSLSQHEPRLVRVPARLTVGDAYSGYSARTLAGEQLALDTLRGDAVLLNVWATWCGPCRQEMPQLQRLHERYADHGLRVIGISIDTQSPTKVREFLRERGITYPSLLDEKSRLVREFGWATGIPQVLLLDRSGRIVLHRQGFPLGADTDTVLEAAVREVIRRRPGA